MNQPIINNEEEINETDTSLSELDPFYWKIPVSDSFRVQLVQIGSGPFQNKDGPFKSTPRENTKGNIRNLTLKWFYQVMPDREKVLRKWMVYSPGSGNLYCFCCRLFTNTINDSSSSFVTGFNTWWKLNPKVRDHEKSSNHLDHKTWRAIEFLEFIVKYDFVESVPNIALSLRLFLTICVSVASCERSFSKLKLIKTYLRSTMSESRLTNLAILSIAFYRGY